MDNELEVQKTIDSLCNQFEEHWVPDIPPDFEDCLNRIQQSHRSQLLQALLQVDLELRTKAGQQIQADDYNQLGDEAVAFVNQILQEQDNAETLDTTRDQATLPPASPLKQIGPYKLLQQIGEGGMGTVWMAEQEKPIRRRVALKLIKAGVDNKQVVARFEAERQALAMMDHQNIARVLDAGTTDTGQPYFVMELVQGIPFTKYCDQNKLSINERLELFVPVCKAIQHAHQKGIIHRDIKPSNVLVCLYDGKPVPKVIDFGLAKALQHQSRLTDKTMFTEFGQVVGTLQYMSPEQAEMNQLDIDTRTDVYSLGVMLYELLTGSTPIEQDSLKNIAILKILQTIREKDPPRPSARLSSSTNEAITGISGQRRIDANKLKNILQGELDWIVMRALEKDRTRRYETANGFADDIGNYLQGNIVSAKPPSTSYRVRKYVSKHKGLVASLGTIATLLVAGIIGTSWFAWEANAKTAEVTTEKANVEKEKAKVERERDRANENENLAKSEAERATKESIAARNSEEKAQATLARSNYFLAVARWDANRAREANEYLDLVPAKYRQFEWYLARRQFQGGYMTCYGHKGSVSSVAFSPDGARIVSGSYDNTLKLWDAATGQELRTLKGHTGWVSSVAFSPDGARIVSGSWDKTLKLWDAATGQELRTFFQGYTSYVYSVAFSPDGARIVSGSGVTLKLWDAASGQKLRTLKGHTDYVSSVAFSPDGARIVSGSVDKTLKMWDAATGQELRTLHGHTQHVTSVAFSADGALIVSGSDDNTIKVWDASSGEELRTLKGHMREVTSVAFSPDGARIVSASYDQTQKLWDAATGQELRTLKGHTGYVESVAFSPDGARIVSGSVDHTLKQWDAATGQELRTLQGHSDGVNSVAFSPDGARIVSGSYDNTLKLWDAATGQELRTLQAHSDGVNSVAFSPDGARIVSGSYDNTLKLWDAATGQELRTLKGHTGPVYSVAFSPVGARIVSGSYDNRLTLYENTLKLWDAATGQELSTLRGANTQTVTGVAFSPDGARIVSGSDVMTLKLWDAATGQELRTLKGHTGPVYSVAFSPDGARIVSGSYDNTLKLWDAATGQELRTLLGHTGGVDSVAFSPDGARIVSGSYDSTLKLWDATTGQELRTLQGHTHTVTSVAFSPDGARIVSGSRDNTIKVWEASSDEELKTLKGHTSGVTSVDFSPDDARIYSQADRTEQFVWDVEAEKRLESEPWQDFNQQKCVSNDGRWLLTSSGEKVLLVDLQFKNRPYERAIRESKAKLNPIWHREQAQQAAQNNNWYAATFHWAWVMKSDPEQADAWDQLHEAHEKLTAEYAALGKELALLLHPVVTEMLQLPRGNKLPAN